MNLLEGSGKPREDLPVKFHGLELLRNTFNSREIFELNQNILLFKALTLFFEEKRAFDASVEALSTSQRHIYDGKCAWPRRHVYQQAKGGRASLPAYERPSQMVVLIMLRGAGRMPAPR